MSQDQRKSACYYAICPDHGWEGMQRETWAEAQADLEGHLGWFPAETHDGAKVASC